MIEELGRMTREWDESATVLEFLLDWTASGKRLTQLAQTINKRRDLPEDTGVSRAMVSSYANSLAPDADRQLAAARKPGAHALTDESLDIADAAKDKDSAAAARVQVGARQWLAERWNREDLGQQKAPLIQLNVNTMHLDALRRMTLSEGETDADPVMRARVSSEPDRLVSATEDATDVSIEPATASD